MQVQGIVEEIQSSPAGRGTAYRIKVQGAFYGCGFQPPSCAQGDNVSFNVEQRGKYMNVAGPIQVLAQGQVPPQAQQEPSPQPQPASRAQSGREKYWEDKEKRDVQTQKAIRYQSSRNAAIEIVTSALENDALSLGQKKAEKLDNLLAIVNEITDVFEKDVQDIIERGERTAEYAPKSEQAGEWDE